MVKKTAVYEFFRFTGSVTNIADVQNPLKWIAVKGPVCNSSAPGDFACAIQVSDAYTHTVENLEILNTPVSHPLGESYITLTSETSSVGLQRIKTLPGLPYKILNGKF
jgi:hypothetical protein